MNALQVASVVLESAMYEFDKPYDYLVPQGKNVLPGCRVTVPFGRANRTRQGVVIGVGGENTDKKLKYILEVIDDTPILSEEMLKLCLWLREYTFCTYFDAVRTVLPVGINFKSNEVYKVNAEFAHYDDLNTDEKTLYDFLCNRDGVTKNQISRELPQFSKTLKTLNAKGAVILESSLVRKVSEATIKSVCLDIEPELIESMPLTPRQKEVAELVTAAGTLSVKEIQYFTGVTASVITALEQKGVLKTFKQDVYRIPYRFSGGENRTEIVLNAEQQTAYSDISSDLSSKEKKPWLLYGITGSGKTQIFLKLVDDILNSGKGAIIMVPEISLTPQTIQLFGKRYGNKIAVFHSAMSLGQRMDEWRRVSSGEAVIAIGTRSAVFAPVKNLGLIIMDEEQEHSYKSESSPRFHARDVAKFRALYNNATLLLASATPSVESFANADADKYNKAVLKHRYASATLPNVITVDMRSQITGNNRSSFSSELTALLKNTLESGNQSILLLNRRGHNTFISCSSCGEVASCPNCSISLTYHSANGRLMCHYCGYSVSAEQTCSKCGGKHLKYMGVGTQKVEQEINQLFPEARVLRLDADTTIARNSFDNKLSDFANGKYDILLGTQMVAKGLNFPKVTLVGVMGIDSIMHSEDFRSFERAFALLTQVVGRAGRGEEKGTALIQTINPDDNLIKLAAAQDYDAFYNGEIMSRKARIFPPYCDITLVCVTAPLKQDASDAINEIFANIKTLTAQEYSDVKIIILGPSPAAMPRVNNRYRYRMIIKSKNNKQFRALLRKAVSIKKNGDVSVFVDINPESIF